MSSKSPYLFRSILREHRKRLPVLMRKLGDDYVRSEFRAHKTAKPEQVAQFMHGWNDYMVSSYQNTHNMSLLVMHTLVINMPDSHLFQPSP